MTSTTDRVPGNERKDTGTDIKPGNEAARRPQGPGAMTPPKGMGQQHMSLVTDHGKTNIADSVVAKIAGLAARDIPGVHSMGTGMARRMGQLRSLIPGSTETSSASQGVAVEVGEKEAAVDLDLVTWYGQSIVDVTSAVRDHVIDQVEAMTGLKVVEVNISVDDIFVETAQPEQPAEEHRVQ
jgi:uncharacterized alkaline shock family protein YloU